MLAAVEADPVFGSEFTPIAGDDAVAADFTGEGIPA